MPDLLSVFGGPCGPAHAGACGVDVKGSLQRGREQPARVAGPLAGPGWPQRPHAPQRGQQQLQVPRTGALRAPCPDKPSGGQCQACWCAEGLCRVGELHEQCKQPPLRGGAKRVANKACRGAAARRCRRRCG